MLCTKVGCGKSWDPDGEQFPLCITYDCPLREARDKRINAQHSSRMKWPTKGKIKESFAKRQGGTTLGIKKNQFTITKKIHKYVLGKGKQKATTKLKPRGRMRLHHFSFDTKDQMHSEMRAIAHMLDAGLWILQNGKITWKNGDAIEQKYFSTEEPHCGFCTLFLQVLGLPLSKPTHGNYNQAVNCLYQLPLQVKRSPHVLARILSGDSYTAFHLIKLILNAFIPLDPEEWALSVGGVLYGDTGITLKSVKQVLTWESVCTDRNGEVLDQIWQHVFSCIYQVNQQKKSEKKE